jgi:predicted kinase
MNKLTEWLTKPFLDENVDLPISIGDTVKMGKFKNKKVVVKKIDWNEKGDLLINGRPALKFRLMPKTNIFDKEEVTEGVNDPGIFKAVFLAGGPGSGKTFVGGGLFGIPDKVNVSAYGLKMVNQDTELEMFLKKYFGSTDLDNMSDDLFRQITDPSYSAHMGVRKHAKALSKQRLKLYSQGRLGVIVDGTGHKYKSVKKERQKLIDLGYDTYMVFVNTSLETALRRNQYVERGRPVPEHIVIKSHKEVQANRRRLMNIFGRNYVEVDNDKDLDVINSNVYKKIVSLQRIPYSKARAKRWYADEIALKKLAGQKGGSVGGIFGSMFGKK